MSSNLGSACVLSSRQISLYLFIVNVYFLDYFMYSLHAVFSMLLSKRGLYRYYKNTIEGGQKDVYSLEGSTLKKVLFPNIWY